MIGVRRNVITGLIECRCEWKARDAISGKGVEFPLTSWVVMEELKNRDPEVLLQYFEFASKVFGLFKEKYPLYFPKEYKEFMDDVNKGYSKV